MEVLKEQKSFWRKKLNSFRYILFAILCGVSLFVNSYSFHDPQIVPKWLFAKGVFALCFCIIPAMQLCLRFRQGKRLNVHGLYMLVLLLCGLQALMGIGQFFYGLLFHSEIWVVGCFDNPAGLVSCLCVVLPFAYPFSKSRKKVVRLLSCILMACFVMVVCFSGSRAGMLSLLVMVGCVGYPRFRSFRMCQKAGIVLILVISIGGAYFIKKDSADGRMLIWKCTWMMIKEHPIIGHGIGAFQAHYMDYQATYFKGNPESEWKMLADNIRHPFNEYLHLWVQGGIGVLLVVFILSLCLYRCYVRSPSWNKKGAALSLLSLSVFSLFSYPFNYPFTWIVLVLDLYVLVRNQPYLYVLRKYKKVFTLCLGIIGAIYLVRIAEDFKNEREWKKIADKSLMGQTGRMLPRYKKLSKKLSNNPYFLYNYAAELYAERRYEGCLKVGLQCRKYWADYDLEILLGDAYTRLGRYEEAVARLELAAVMCPVRFTPLYKLYCIHKSWGRKEEAHALAWRIFHKEVKISSAEIDRIKVEVGEGIKSCQNKKDNGTFGFQVVETVIP